MRASMSIETAWGACSCSLELPPSLPVRLHLDAFEQIAKEGRKHNLTMVMATQRPRDIPDGVLSQMARC